MKLVYWPLMGGLLHLVQRGGDWAGPQPGLPWGLNFNAHTHPIPTVKPVGIPTESRNHPYPYPTRCVFLFDAYIMLFFVMYAICMYYHSMYSVLYCVMHGHHNSTCTNQIKSNRPMGFHHSPHTHPTPIPTGIPMGIPIPTAALAPARPGPSSLYQM